MAGYIPEEGIRLLLFQTWHTCYWSIRFSETLQILLDCDHTTEKGMEASKRIEQLFKDRCLKFKEAI